MISVQQGIVARELSRRIQHMRLLRQVMIVGEGDVEGYPEAIEEILEQIVEADGVDHVDAVGIEVAHRLDEPLDAIPEIDFQLRYLEVERGEIEARVIDGPAIEEVHMRADPRRQRRRI